MVPDGHRDFAKKILADHGVPELPDGRDRPAQLLGWTDGHRGAAGRGGAHATRR